MKTSHKLAISKGLLGHKISEATKLKISLAQRKRVIRYCSTCTKPKEVQPSKARRYSKHFCSQACYTAFKKTIPPELHPRWKGGITRYQAHRRWVASHPEHMAHLKARRYARERNAEGRHSLGAWHKMEAIFGGRCWECGEVKPLTKDHIIPLSAGGTDYIWNIQPLCRNCNSKKWAKLSIYEHPTLLQEEKFFEELLKGNV